MVHRVFFLLVTILFLPLVFTGGSLTAAAPMERPAVSRFGIVESTEAPQAADELGIGWTRLSFHWGEIQPDGPDSWQPEFSDDQIDLELASGREIMGLLIGIPDWARDESGLPRGLYRPTSDPENSWATFVHRIVSTYKGRVDHWIIWNEPDIAETEIAHTWDGTVADFARLQRVAYLAAKEANPRSVIHLAAFTYWADYYAGNEQYMARLLDELAMDSESAKYHSYFDVATAHLYFQPDQIYELLNLFQGIMRERGLAQPIWLVETNAPPRNDPHWPVPNWTLSVYLDEQAAFMPQALASALAAGAERVAVYKLQDTAEDRQANPEPFGLLRQDGTKRPAFDTLQVAVRQLAGMTAVQRERWNEVGQIRIDQTGQSTTVVFSRLPSPQQARVPATAAEATLLDMWGNSQPIAPTSGIFEIDLPPSPCSHSIGDYCMIGGPTYYLVQEAPVPPTPTPVPPTPTVLTPSPSATATQTPVPTRTPTAAPTETSPSTPAALRESSSATAAPTATRQAAVNDQGAALGNVVLPVITGVVLVFGVAGILFMLLRRR